jgi:hypothetical protein
MEKDDGSKSESVKSWVNEVYQSKPEVQVPKSSRVQEEKEPKSAYQRLEDAQSKLMGAMSSVENKIDKAIEEAGSQAIDPSLLTCCRACGKDISKQSYSCVHCGQPSKWWRFLRSAMSFLFILLLLNMMR